MSNTTTTNTTSTNQTNNQRSPALQHSATSGDPTHQHHHGHHGSSNTATHGHTGSGLTQTDNVVKTGNYQTGLESSTSATTMGGGSVPVVGNSYQNRLTGTNSVPGVSSMQSMGVQPTSASALNGDGLVVNQGLGGPLSSSVVMGGQCECLMNGGTCSHGAGKCICRGCTTRATTINPGINIGVSTTQYTAPVSTTGIGGGVADRGVGIAGVMHPSNASGAYVTPSDANCDCVKKSGSCNCAPGTCACTTCTTKRQSMQHTTGHHHHPHHAAATTTTTTQSQTHRQNVDSVPMGGSEYASGNTKPDSSYRSSVQTTTTGMTAGNRATSPITDNSNYPYPPKDFTAAQPVTQGKNDPTAAKSTNSTSGVV